MVASSSLQAWLTHHFYLQICSFLALLAEIAALAVYPQPFSAYPKNISMLALLVTDRQTILLGYSLAGLSAGVGCKPVLSFILTLACMFAGLLSYLFTVVDSQVRTSFSRKGC